MRRRHGYRSRSAGVRRTTRKTALHDPNVPARNRVRAELRADRLTASGISPFRSPRDRAITAADSARTSE